jgi:hypothetical protein
MWGKYVKTPHIWKTLQMTKNAEKHGFLVLVVFIHPYLLRYLFYANVIAFAKD